MLKEQIIKEMCVKPEINPEGEISQRIHFIQQQLLQSGLTTLVLGISGGVDSATCGRLCQLAIEDLRSRFPAQNYQFIAVRLPYDTQVDEADAQHALEFIQPDKVLVINVKAGSDGIHKQVTRAMASQKLLHHNQQQLDFAKGNVKARCRMAAQYEVAGLLNGLVVGTDHSAENVTGFYTKFGDGACDLAPLFGLNKRQVRLLAKTLGADDAIVNKTPTADLQTLMPALPDEEELGLSYHDIDDFLEGKPVSTAIENRITALYQQTQHKRQAIAIMDQQKA